MKHPKVTLLQTTVIPGNHEVLLAGQVQKVDLTDDRDAILEPTTQEPAGLIVARSLVKTRETIPIRVVNLSEDAVELPAGHLLGKLEYIPEKDDEGGQVYIRQIGEDRHQGPPEPEDVLYASDAVLELGTRSPDRVSGPSLPSLPADEDIVPEHLKELYASTVENIGSPAIRQKLAGILVNRRKAFAQHRLEYGNFDQIKHTINTGCAAPFRDRVRKTPRGFEAEEEKCLKEQLESGVIRPSSSPWAAATVLVRKADSTVRWCIDYRGVNNRSVRDAYPLPRIDLCLQSLGSVRYFTTLDLQSGYWQIQVEESDIPKTAFITKYGLFEYTKMPFGLCNAPGTFQRCMELVFRGPQWKTLLIYLDDIIILGSTMEENLDRLDEALSRLQEANLKLKPSKCKILREEVLFLGHLVSAAGLRPNPRLIETVKNWTRPTTRREVQQFLGLCNYYRRFVPQFSEKAGPLSELTSKNVEFCWTDQVQQSFEVLKEALCRTPILVYPLQKGEFVLDTDASDGGIGAVLSQVQEGEEKVVAYASKKLNKQQQRYCVTRRELLAVVVFLREFRHFLLGNPFIIRTDHSSLTWLLNFKEPQGQMARWIEYIFEFKFQIVFRPGKKHLNADSMSRTPEPQLCANYNAQVPLEDLPCKGCGYCQRRQQEWEDFEKEVDNVIPLSMRQVTTRSHTTSGRANPSDPPKVSVEPSSTRAGPQVDNVISGEAIAPTREGSVNSPTSWTKSYSSAELSTTQKLDSDLQPVHAWFETGKLPAREEAAILSPATRCYWLNFSNLERIDGVLYQLWVDPSGARTTQRQLLVPKKMRKKVLEVCHDSLLAGHQGTQRTVNRMKQRFHWPGLSRDVKMHICACAVCGANRMPYRKFRAALGNFRVGAPLDRLGIDLMGPLPETSEGNRYLLVLVDYFTRWAEAYPLPDQQAETVARTLVGEFVCRFGAPLELHSDQGRQFESCLFQEVCRLLDICKTRTSPYHPSSNGLVERFNRTLASLIRKYLDDHITEWDRHIPFLTSAYRSTVHPSTGFTPNYLMFGREVTTPVDLIFPRPRGEVSVDVCQYVSELRHRIEDAYTVARENLKDAADHQKKNHDTRMVQNRFQPGDLVYKRNHNTKKLETPWVGPYVIKKLVGDCLYRVSDRKKVYVLHHNLLKPYISQDVPKWVKALVAPLKQVTNV